MAQKKKEKPEKKIKHAIFVRSDDGRKTEKRLNESLRTQQTSSAENITVIKNEAKRVPNSSGSNIRVSKTASKTKEPAKEAKIHPNKAVSKTSSMKRISVPMRTSHAALAKSIVSPQNVMNQEHNVTVSSPPSMRRKQEKIKAKKVDVVATRDRMRTRTLEKSEVTLLKPKSEITAQMESPTMKHSSDLQRTNVEIRQPVSFEVYFTDDNNQQINNLPPLVTDEDKVESYEDDFESYESDFEDESDESQQSSKSDRSSPSVGDISSSKSEVCEERSIENHPFEVNKVNEVSNSGSFEMRTISSARSSQNEHLSVDLQQSVNVETQRDSGIELLPGASNQLTSSSCGGPLSSLDISNSKTFDNISDIEIETSVNSLYSPTVGNSVKCKSAHFKNITKLNRRGVELLKKITLDTMYFVSYDCQPIPYDLFMQIYGRNDSSQVSTQTHNIRMDQDMQSEPIDLDDVWTQHPPTFYTRHIIGKMFDEYENGCSARIACQSKAIGMTLTDCVKRLQHYSMPKRRNMSETQISEINYNQLNRFLLANEVTMSRLFSNMKNDDQLQFDDSIVSGSLGYFPIELDMHEFQILQIHASPALPGFLFTLHHEINGHLYLIAVWDLAFAKKPVCLLSSWTTVLCIGFHASARALVFAGLDDGLVGFP